MLRDQQLPSSAGGFHPHLFDAYIPNGPIQFVVVALHGGNGGKAFIPQVLGVTYAADPTVRQVNWNMLDRFNTALIVPQGQHCDGTVGPFNPNGANTVTEMNPRAWPPGATTPCGPALTTWPCSRTWRCGSPSSGVAWPAC
jgi:hypothetical protein